MLVEASSDLLLGALNDYLEATYDEEDYALFVAQANADPSFLESCLTAINNVSAFMALAMVGEDEMFLAVAPSMCYRISRFKHPAKNIWMHHLMNYESLDLSPAFADRADVYQKRMQWVLDRIDALS